MVKNREKKSAHSRALRYAALVKANDGYPRITRSLNWFDIFDAYVAGFVTGQRNSK